MSDITIEGAIAELAEAQSEVYRAKRDETAIRNHVIDMEHKYDEKRTALLKVLKAQPWFQDIAYYLQTEKD